jgi:hypothetical protein
MLLVLLCVVAGLLAWAWPKLRPAGPVAFEDMSEGWVRDQWRPRVDRDYGAVPTWPWRRR